MKFIRVWACAAALFFGIPFALAQANQGVSGKPNVIENLAVGKAGGNTVVKIDLRQALTATPSNFVIANPARVVFDFPATENGLGYSNKTVNEGGLRSFSLVQAGERSRLVLNLDKASRFEARQEDKTLLITLFEEGTVGGAAANVTTTQHFATIGKDAVASVRDIQFRRNKDGAGVVMVDLSSSDTGIDVRQKGKSLYVSFKKTQLPESLRRKLDVVDFGTPVNSVNTRSEGDGVTMEIVPNGLWEHTAYQSDNQFIVEVRPVKEDPNKLFQGSRKGYQGEAISLNFQNIPLRELLHVFADITNFNIVISDSVGGNVSLRLNDVPWDQALEIVLQQKNLAMRKNGSVIWIAPQDELVARDEQMIKARESAAVADPPRLELFQLNYVKAEDLLAMLKQEKQDTKGKDTESGFLSSIGKVTVDKRTNQVFIYDVPVKLEMIRNFLKEIDRPVRQVLIEARIVEATTQFSKALGARLGGNDLQGLTQGHKILGNKGVMYGLSGSGTDSYRAGYLPTDPTAAVNASSLLAPGALLSNNGISGTTTPTGQFALTLFNSAKTQLLTLEIQAQEADGKGKTISSPRIMTMDQMEADIKQGFRVPYLEASASGATSIKYIDAVLSLKVKPQITPDGSVMMKLKINKDALGPATAIGPTINTKEINSDVLVENGGTVIIGGIFEQEELNSTTRIPFLGDLPYVGFMFKSNTKSENRTELLVMITPRVIDTALSIK
jgi:type IV pilus assembly protein PilQ